VTVAQLRAAIEAARAAGSTMETPKKSAKKADLVAALKAEQAAGDEQ
jgi:hypothetical protein